MKYTVDEISKLRALARPIALATLMQQHVSREIRASNYEMAALTESMTQTYIAAGIVAADLEKLSDTMQQWVDKQVSLQ